MHIDDIETPALIVHEDILDANLRRMADYFKDKPAKLRPHAKTHKCAAIAKRQLALGAVGITCAKLGEAESMVDNGIDGILITNEIVGANRIRRLVELCQRASVIVAVDDLGNAAEIGCAARDAGISARVLVELDVGMHRSGVTPGDECLAFVHELSTIGGIEFKGIMGYEGHAVFIQDSAERQKVAGQSMTLLADAAKLLRREGVTVEIVSGGGTGTYDISGQVEGITEIQAGSYIFMDDRYRGVVSGFGQALHVLSTVVSAKSATRIITDCGMKSVTREFGMPTVKDRPDLQIDRLCEENAIISSTTGSIPKIGERLMISPSHGCTTVNLHDRYHVVRGSEVVDIWEINARGRSA